MSDRGNWHLKVFLGSRKRFFFFFMVFSIPNPTSHGKTHRHRTPTNLCVDYTFLKFCRTPQGGHPLGIAWRRNNKPSRYVNFPPGGFSSAIKKIPSPGGKLHRLRYIGRLSQPSYQGLGLSPQRKPPCSGQMNMGTDVVGITSRCIVDLKKIVKDHSFMRV